MNWFKGKKQTHDFAVAPTPIVDLPQLRIFGLQQSLDLIGYKITKGDKPLATIFLPTLTRDGRLSYIVGGGLEDFEVLRSDIKERFGKHLKELYADHQPSELFLGQFLVVGYTLTTEKEWSSGVVHLIYETLVTPKPIDEMAHIYGLIHENTESGTLPFFTDPNSHQTQWLNTVITDLEKMLDWPNFVAKSEQMWYEKYDRQGSK